MEIPTYDQLQMLLKYRFELGVTIETFRPVLIEEHKNKLRLVKEYDRVVKFLKTNEFTDKEYSPNK